MIPRLNEGDGLSEDNHHRVADYIGRIAGIQLPSHKRNLIETRLRKRVMATRRESISDYLDYAFSPAGEQERLAMVDALTTNKTDFFREPAHFAFLSQTLNRWLDNRECPSEVRIWSAACSTGEEPYTLAMVCDEVRRTRPALRFHIDATDICSTALAHARNAVYREERIAPVAEPIRKRYLLRSRDSSKGLIRVGPELRQHVSFSAFNLITGRYPNAASYDVIFCRNVMIYFNQADRHRVTENLAMTLKTGGLLFLGHSESAGEHRGLLSGVGPTIYRREG